MSQLHIFLPDADGCFFGWNYYKLFIQVLNTHWDFINTFGEYPQTIPDRADEVRSIVNKMIHELDSIQLPEGIALLGMVTHARFKEAIDEQYNELLSKNDNQVTPTAWEVLSPILTKCIGYMNRIDSRLYKALCLQANKELILQFSAKYHESDAQYIVCMLGTNRQSFAGDKLGCELNGTGPFALSLGHLQYAFQFFLPKKKIIVSPFSLADIYGDLPRGESFNRILRTHNENAEVEDHAEFIFDHSKVTLIYAVAHDVVTHILPQLGLAADTNVTMDFCDDLIQLLKELGATVIISPELLPKNNTLNLNHYCGTGEAECITSVQGKGEPDPNYRENVKLMARMSGAGNPFVKSINVAENFELNLENFLKVRTLNLNERKENKVSQPEVKANTEIPKPTPSTQAKKIAPPNKTTLFYRHCLLPKPQLSTSKKFGLNTGVEKVSMFKSKKPQIRKSRTQVENTTHPRKCFIKP